jgi:ubiquinone/menaquinone biosynthesis C-methylase UbiE
MGILQDYFDKNTSGLRLDKWMPYLEIYERHFERYRGTDVHVLEIGVFGGGSLQMWKDYFGPQSQIFGVDINPGQCHVFLSRHSKAFLWQVIPTIC